MYYLSLCAKRTCNYTRRAIAGSNNYCIKKYYNESSYIYDIRTSEYALCTLVNFTGVVPPIWEKYIQLQGRYRYDEDLVADVIAKHGKMPPNYEEWLLLLVQIGVNPLKRMVF